jgi:hypothetical protein
MPPGVPFIFGNPAVIVGVNDGVLAVREGDSSKSIAVSQPAIQQQDEDDRPFEVRRNFDGKVELNGKLPIAVFSE